MQKIDLLDVQGINMDEAIIVYLVSTLHKKLDRKAFQKVVYILEFWGVPITYTFRFWSFGPYSVELTYMLDYLIALDIIRVDAEDKKLYAPERYPRAYFEFYDRNMKALHEINQILQWLERITEFNPNKLKLFAIVHFLFKENKIYDITKILDICKRTGYTTEEINEISALYNQLVAKLQDHYEKMSFEELVNISEDEWKIMEYIFPTEMRNMMKDNVIKILKERKKG